MKANISLIAVLFMMGVACDALGWMTEQIGPTTNEIAQPSWPSGVLGIVNHKSRVYSSNCNFNDNFYFKASPTDINEIINLFSEVRLRDHVLTVKEKTTPKKTIRWGDIDYNIELHIPNRIHIVDGTPRSRTREADMSLMVDADADESFWNQIVLPPNVILVNEVARCPLQGSEVKPERKDWYGKVLFDDATPAVDFETGVVTMITLWEKCEDDGIKLGKVGRDGYFYLPFSEKELADIKNGKSWVTLTVGNHLVKAEKNHPRLVADKLSLDKPDAQPVTLKSPKYLYGRILFDDDSVPVLEDKQWSPAVNVSFPYAGVVTLDENGYFKVYFSENQYEKMKTRRDGKNIYIPKGDGKGGSSAEHIFPLSKLSRKKEATGVVRIPKPEFVK